MTNPLITIGITCYNAEETIARALQAALDQTWPNKEIIIVDDCSEDNSQRIIEEFRNAHPGIKFFKHEHNKGFPAALNTILTNAHGEYIAFFDDDDYSYPERLEEQYRRISEFGKELVLCYSNREVVSEGETEVDHIAKAAGRRPPEPHGVMMADCLLLGDTLQGYVWGNLGSCTLMASKNVFNRIGPFDESLRRCAEWDYAIRGSFLDTCFIAVDKPLIRQFKTAGAQKSGKRPLYYLCRIITKHKIYLKKSHKFFLAHAKARARFYDFRNDMARHKFYKRIGKIISGIIRCYPASQTKHILKK